ncbi:E3 ubiquitin-protein ligase UBR4 [Fistulifera solaris]|uniref:E3 ubiquitin-protein ligase UBR4 n=1 Tax=Fistulifera solaris TaxID=1519565 RepID=A0A1Z5JCR9_FISSO|nr:E3 ubiquitin-protein ligase UBR4 [Fistulifera solaris]|eukprot:GAX11800.1 E3 ubiquitin-protein ligase UBR4 [Fistulifera solaris]
MNSNDAEDKLPEAGNSASKIHAGMKPLTWSQTSRTALLAGIQAHNQRGAVEEAFKREEAVRRIERAWCRYRHGQKPASENSRKREISREISSLPQSSASNDKEHWLWKSLRSYSKSERETAASLLLDTIEGPDLDYEHQRRIPPLVRLFQRHVVLHNDLPAEVALEWMAILQTMISRDPRCFLSYWDWVTDAIWRCAHRRDLTALCSLTSLVFQLSIQTPSNSESSKDGLLTFNHDILWGDKRLKKIVSGDDSDHQNMVETVVHMSPLARLIGAYFATLAEGSQLTSTPSARNETLSMLKQIIDPTVPPTIFLNSTVSTNKRGIDETAEGNTNPSPRKRRRTVSLLEGYDSDFTNSGVGAAVDPSNEALAWADEYNGEDDEDEEDEENVDKTDGRSETNVGGEPTEKSRSRSFGYDEDEHNEDVDDEESKSKEEEANEEHSEDDGDEDYCHMYRSEKLEIADSDESEVEESDEDDVEAEDDDVMVAVDANESTNLHSGAKASGGDIQMPENDQVENRVVTLPLHPPTAERQKMYVAACMEVLTTHYPPSQQTAGGTCRQSYLQWQGEHDLIQSINSVIKPQKKPSNLKVIMRRAPTQEEFFRGSLSQNPVPISALKIQNTRRSNDTDVSEPTVGDLRQHIADDLQMSDSAELIEILVANKILHTNLKLRVVHQVLWRQHLIEQPSSGLMSFLSSGSFFARGSGLSIFFSSDRDHDDEARPPNAVTEDTPLSELPSLLATYRLAGVDGEATEDTVGVEDIIDPDAPSKASSPEEKERQLEAEFGNTRLVTNGKGVYVLLRSIQHSVLDAVRKVHRDDVDCSKNNPSRLSLRQSRPCEGLQLLRHCAKLQQNRKRLLQARAPTILLALLLEVLKALEGDNSSTLDASASCPTAELLQELIESLTSDISITNADTGDDYEVYLDFDASSMPLLLTSIESMCLSAPLRRVIAKLLPFLTYGRSDLSRELAQQFDRHICLQKIVNIEICKSPKSEFVLMKTLVDTLINLPVNEICNSLRDKLISCGFVERLAAFVLKDMPQDPPTWTAALWPEHGVPQSTFSENSVDHTIREGWRALFGRLGVKTVFKILTGLCQHHAPMQRCLANFPKFLQCCHWIEATSDNPADNIATSGLGLLAETLLDEVGEGNNEVSAMVTSIRNETKLRKKAIALERRKATMLKMGVYIGGVSSCDNNMAVQKAGPTAVNVLGSIGDVYAPQALSQSPSRSTQKGRQSKKKEEQNNKPGWLAEAESMADETGLKCVVCHEGRTLQPKELLALYTFTKKVVLPSGKNMTRSSIDGTDVLKVLPAKIPVNLIDDAFSEEWLRRALEAKLAVQRLPAEPSQSRRSLVFVTTTSAGNAIHISCHQRAKQADRTHPKAPKSEWEGASLRNNRVKCNCTLPLIHNRDSAVPLIDVTTGLSDYQSALASILGSSSSCMLWHILHDIRFLLLRIAYGESLNADAGGGSLASNCQLLFRQMHLAETFAKQTDDEQKESLIHAQGVSAGCLLACGVVFKENSKKENSELLRAVADGTLMGAIISIIFYNTKACGGLKVDITSEKPHPKREWVIGRDRYLRGLIVCAGRRHVLNLNSSGCLPGRTLSGRKRSSSFAEWDNNDKEEAVSPTETASPRSKSKTRRRAGRSSARPNMPSIDDFQNAFRPMITLFAILDQLSAEFTQTMDDNQIETSSQRMVQIIEDSQASRGIQELLRKAKVPLDNGQLISLLQRGMVLG